MFADAVGYHSAIRFGIEHGKRNMIQADYSSTAFLYTQPNDTTTFGDEVNPADPLSRAQHGYTDAAATDQILLSEYEGNDDTRTIAGLVRATAAPITFHVSIPPDNHGILLRRTSDQSTVTNQRTSPLTAHPPGPG